MLMRMEGNSGTNVSINKDQEDTANLISISGSSKDGQGGSSSGAVEKEGDTRVTTSHSSSPSSSSLPEKLILDAGTTSLASSENPASLSGAVAAGIGGGGGGLPTSSQQSAAAALIASKQKLLQKENLRRVMNPPKLERKHSSGDLHSRLKTRKILGVGETDNGDIHRSKISQVLGHNEHLYVRFPSGIWNWQAFLSVILFVQAVLILFFPNQASQLKLLGIQLQQDKEGLMMASKYYAVALLALSFTFWRFMYIRDKSVVRTVQLVALIYSSSLCAIDLISAVSTEISHLYDLPLLIVMGVRLGTALICSMYLNRIGNATSGLRRSPSHNKDLGESTKKDG